jgi:gas vesicle protein
MSNEQQGGGGAGVLLAFLAGAAVGAAVALLFAPAPGSETRELVSRRAREGRERAAEAARRGREILHSQRENITTGFERVGAQVQGGGRDPEPDA